MVLKLVRESQLEIADGARAVVVFDPVAEAQILSKAYLGPFGPNGARLGGGADAATVVAARLHDSVAESKAPSRSY